MTIRAKNWPSMQSYKDRKPPWIRLHKSLIDNYEYQMMSAEARALLPMLWLLASEDEDPTSGLVTDSIQKISFRLRQPIETVTNALQEITDAGFFEEIQACNESVTDKLQSRIQTVTSETETETETETDTCDLPTGKVTKLQKKSYPSPRQVVDLYHQMLPELPSVVKITQARGKAINARSRTDMETLEDWENYFDDVRNSKFLMGQVDPPPGRKQFIADIDFLIRESTIVKTQEGKYHGASR